MIRALLVSALVLAPLAAPAFPHGARASIGRISPRAPAPVIRPKIRPALPAMPRRDAAPLPSPDGGASAFTWPLLWLLLGGSGASEAGAGLPPCEGASGAPAAVSARPCAQKEGGR